MSREQRRSVFDVTNVTRVMSHNLPAGVKISRDAKECMCQIASEMTGFVTMEASAIAKVNVANGVRPNIKIHTHTYTHTSAYAYIYICICICIHIYTYAYAYAYHITYITYALYSLRVAAICICTICTQYGCTHYGFTHLQTSRISKAAVGLDECVWAFPRLGLEGFLPTIKHWVQATHDARMASRRRHCAHL